MSSEITDTIYDANFYDRQSEGSRESAEQVVPFLIDHLRPESVVDVGCGLGTWLSVFMENKVEDVLGLDGGYVDQNALLIPKNNFQATDLENPIQLNRITIPLQISRDLKFAFNSLKKIFIFASPYTAEAIFRLAYSR